MALLPAALGGRTVQEHLAQLQAQIRAEPQKAALRLALCHFLALRGEWTRAQDQARQARKLDAALTPAAGACEMAVRGEIQREAFWRGEGEPVAMNGAHPDWARLLIQAAALADADPGEAAALRARAMETAPALACALTLAGGATAPEDDPEPVESLAATWISDGDARLGPVLELFTGEGYGWLPMSALRRVTLRRPRHLVDLLWAPVELGLCDGSTGSALMPVRYAGTGALATGAAAGGTGPAGERGETDDALMLARRTDWALLAGEDQYAGRGQRVFITDAGDLPLLELRALDWAGAAAGGTP